MRENKQERKLITINCRAQGRCPSIEFRRKDVFIKDDYGNRVRLSREQWQLLKKVREEK